MCTGIAAPRQCRRPTRSMVLPLVRGRGLPSGRSPRGTVGLGEVYLGTREPARDSRGPTSRRVAPGTGPYLEMCSCRIWLDAITLRLRVPTLELVSAVAGMPGRDAVDKARG